MTDYLVPVGRLREALAEARRARELDPLSVLINGVYGHDALSCWDAWRRRRHSSVA